MEPPITYQTVDPSAAILSGIKMSAGLQGMQQEAQTQQLAQQQAQQQAADLRALAMNPNAGHADYAAAMTLHPALAENLGKAFKMKDEGAQQNLLNFGTKVYSAQLAGNNELAASMYDERAKADPAQAEHWNTLAKLTRDAPATARTISALGLAGAMGPDKFATAFQNLGADARAEEKQPAEVAQAKATAAKTGAEAVTAQVAAGNAPTATALGNEEKRQTILSAEAQRKVADFDSQIKAANSETERGQLTLARDKFVAEQQLKTGQVATDSQAQFDTITQSLDLVKGLQKDLSAEGWFGKWNGVGTATGKLARYIPGTDAKDFAAKVETLKSQQFLTAAKEMKGMGALSDAEGARIERAVASLDTEQTPAAFKTALTTIENTLAKGHAKLIASGKLPKTGGAFEMQHPQFGNVTDADINRLMSQNPGSTRDQVLQFLRSTGGK